MHPFGSKFLVALAILEKVEAILSSRTAKTASKIGPRIGGGLEVAVVWEFSWVEIEFEPFHSGSRTNLEKVLLSAREVKDVRTVL